MYSQLSVKPILETLDRCRWHGLVGHFRDIAAEVFEVLIEVFADGPQHLELPVIKHGSCAKAQLAVLPERVSKTSHNWR